MSLLPYGIHRRSPLCGLEYVIKDKEPEVQVPTRSIKLPLNYNKPPLTPENSQKEANQ